MLYLWPNVLKYWIGWNAIIVKKSKVSIGTAGIYINIIIIFLAMIVFGLPKSIYAIFTLLFVNKIVDFVILGNNDSKLCIIKTKNTTYIEEFLKNDFNIGYSVFESSGGIDKKYRKTIMCVVTSREYYSFKNLILDIDNNAFFVTHNCYEVLGGKRRKLIDLSWLFIKDKTIGLFFIKFKISKYNSK